MPKRNPHDLHKMMQNINDQFNKEFESTKMYDTEIQEINNSAQRMGSRSDQCKESVRTRS